MLQSKCKSAQDYAFTISANASQRGHGHEARPVIITELQQMIDKKAWHAIHTSGLIVQERKAVIRASMLVKDNYMTSEMFDKFKAGGDQQDKEVYDDLLSPTTSTASVFAVATLVVHEGRSAS
jgi:hypothetical protein